MRHRGLLVLVLTTGLTYGACQKQGGLSSPAVESALETIQPGAIRAHIRFLADDLLEGREAGTRGFDLAAKYVAATFEAMGLEPAGPNGTYFQTVPFRTAQVDATRSSFRLIARGRTQTLRPGEDYALSASFLEEESRVRAPLAYVGYGITAPDLDYDDYDGMDVQGKIVVMLSGAPESFPPNQRAFYSSTHKAENAVAHGAVGILNVFLPAMAKRFPWAMVARHLSRPSMRWIDQDGIPNNPFPELKAGGVLGPQMAESLFSEATVAVDEVFSAAEAGESLSFDLPVEAEIRTVSSHGETESPNVIAKLEGSDPELRDEFVVYSSHLDHDGVREGMEGDNIYNGAYDNASGTSVVLEIARAFTRLPKPPKRSILFLSTTAEEKGLFGAEYFAQNPTVPSEGIVANINIDTVAMIYPFRDLVIYGGEHSSLGEVFQQVAGHMDIALSPDPMPEEVLFVRSDQFAFVRQGIPAVFPWIGLQSADPDVDGAAAFQEWMGTRYHTPKDDLSQDMDFESGARYARANFLMGYLVAQQKERPTWNEGDFFGEKFGPAR